MSANRKEFIHDPDPRDCPSQPVRRVRCLRRGRATVAALAAPSSPSATAAPDPCAASEIAQDRRVGGHSTGNYLDSHPQTNQALTTISQQQGGAQSLVALKTYFDANPQVAKDLQQLQPPLTESVRSSASCRSPSRRCSV